MQANNPSLLDLLAATEAELGSVRLKLAEAVQAVNASPHDAEFLEHVEILIDKVDSLTYRLDVLCRADQALAPATSPATDLLAAMPPNVPEKMLGIADTAVRVAPAYANLWYWRVEFEPGQFAVILAAEDASRQALAVAAYEMSLIVNSNVVASQIAVDMQGELDHQRIQ